MINSFTGDYRFLSNFWPCRVGLGVYYYPSVEHAFQAAKTFDLEERKAIASLKTAGQAKKAGRKVKLRPDWDKIKLDVMENLILEKFQDPDLKKMLLDTGDEELIEGNTWGDRFWGVCKGEGHNHLGKILMRVRQRLRG